MFESVAPDLAGLDLPIAGADRATAGAVVSALAALRAAELDSDHEVLDLVAAWERVATWATAQSIAATAEFARRPADSRLGEPGASRGRLGSVVRSHTEDELAVRLGSTNRAAGWRVAAATTLATSMPATGKAFASGRLDVAKTRLMIEECVVGTPEAVAIVEADLLDERAMSQPPSRLRDRLRRAIIAADPDVAARRDDRARADRSVRVIPEADGMSLLLAQLPAEDAAAITAAVDAAARRLKAQPGECRGIEQLRADCLSAPFWQALRTGRLDGIEPITIPGRRGESVAVQVTVPAAVLLGLSDRPGDLAGFGPIPAPVARRLAADGRWRRLLTDPAGCLVDVGRTVYRPSSRLARHVEQRDQRCRFPGCSAPAHRCDLDHVVAFPTGPTSAENLIALCRRHHLLKHGGRGDVRRDDRSGDQDSDRAAVTGSAAAELVWRMPDGSQAASTAPQIGDPGADAALLRVFRPDAPDQLVTPDLPSPPEQEAAPNWSDPRSGPPWEDTG